MIGVIRIGSTVQLRILRIAPCRRCQTVQPRTIGVMQRIRSIPDTRHSPLDIVGDAGNGLCGAGCSQLPQYQSPIRIITVTVAIGEAGVSLQSNIIVFAVLALCFLFDPNFQPFA